MNKCQDWPRVCSNAFVCVKQLYALLLIDQEEGNHSARAGELQVFFSNCLWDWKIEIKEWKDGRKVKEAQKVRRIISVI